MALAGGCPSITDMGVKLYSNEKRAALLFSISAGFAQNPDIIRVPVTCCTAQYLKIQ